jgi:hypothetical protein
LGLAVLVIAIGVGFLVMNKKSSDTFVASPSEVKKEGYSILLYPKSGDVLYKESGGDTFLKATENPTEINNNTVVKTGTGTAIVLLPDNSSISLDENTEITITYSPEHTSILQTLGSTYHRVEALAKGSSYEVKTPGTLAAVRGTKFGVKYDKTKKKTKVSVTEHTVEVKKEVESQATSTKEEMVQVTEGKTISVEERKDLKGNPVVAMITTETIKDTEMKQFVDKERIDDRKIDEMKRMIEEEQKKDTEVQKLEERTQKELFKDMFRKEMKKEIFKDLDNEKEDKNINEIVKKPRVQEEPKVETKEEGTPREETKPVVTETTKSTTKTTKTTTDTTKTTTTTTNTTNTSTSGGTVVKMDEEKFYSTFEPLFIKHFYLDDVDTPCATGAKASDRMKAVLDYAKNNGYPFTSGTLGDFAQQIDTYCSTKDKALKTRLQTRFDDEYPFQ